MAYTFKNIKVWQRAHELVLGRKVACPLFVIFALISVTLFMPIERAAASVLSKTPNDSGLVGYWSFNEGTGTQAGDSSGQGNTGTITGATWVDGKRGKALSFNGTSAYVNLSASNKFIPANNSPVTISLWFNANSISSGQNGNRIVNIHRDSSAGSALALALGENDRVQYYNYADTSTYYFSTHITASRWYHIALTYNGSSFQPYFNGNADGSAVTRSLTGGGSYAAKIGSYDGASTYFAGTLDDIRIYNRALTATEVTALYQSGAARLKAPSNLGLVGYWAFDEGTGTKAGDSSGNKNTGTIASAGWTDGKHGKALDCDGSQNVDITDTALTGTFTMSYWYKTSDNGQTGIIIGEDSGGSGGGPKIGIVTNQLFFRLVSSSDNSVAAPAINQWHHIVLTRDGSDKVDLYVDGGSAQRLFSNAAQSGTYTVSNLSTNGDTSQDFTGSIDDIRIYNRALSASDVQKLYQSGSVKINKSTARITNGLVGYWTFDGPDISGATAYDRSPAGGNNGTITSATLTIGKVGQGMKFNGSTGYINAQSPAIFDNLSAMTVSAWIKPISQGKNSRGPIATKTNTHLGSAGWYFYFTPNANHPNSLSFIVDFDTTDLQHTTSDNSIIMNVWQHVAVTWDGSATATNARIYINGVESAYDPTYGGQTDGVTNRADDSTYSLVIGNCTTANNCTFDGRLDDVHLYSRVLSAAEVEQLYLMGK